MADNSNRRAHLNTASPGSEAPPMHGHNMSVAELIKHGRQRARASTESQHKSDDQLHDALSSALEIYIRFKLGEARDEFETLGIKIDGRTKNPLTPWVKLIFNADKSSNINRNAAALKYALDNEIHPNDLPLFIKKTGGVAKCAALEATARRAAGFKRTSKASKQFQAELTKRRMAAPIIELPDDLELVDEGTFVSILLERAASGRFKALGSFEEDEKTARRFFKGPAPKSASLHPTIGPEDRG